MPAGIRVAVVGATGLVGREMVRVLEERVFPCDPLQVFATARSAGRRVPFRGGELTVEESSEEALRQCDVVLFAGGDDASRRFAWAVAEAGGVAIDNSSIYRMDPRVPLVVPEVNPDALRGHRGVIANPNCCAAVLVLALKPLHDAAKIRRAVVMTYQSVSGAGADNLRALLDQTRALLDETDALSRGQLDVVEARAGTRHPVAFNVLPQWTWGRDGYNEEEEKITAETHKMMGTEFPLIATAVRVPVAVGHTLAVYVEMDRPLAPNEARAILTAAPSVTVADDPEAGVFPTPLQAAGRDDVLVGRIRGDPASLRSLAFVVAGDNLRKGAALNAVQIVEVLVTERLLPRLAVRG